MGETAFNRVLRRLESGASTVSALLFAAMFVPFLLQIFMRFVLNDPLSWTEEASGLFFIWMVFWTTAFVIEIPNEHIKFDLIYKLGSPNVRRVMAIAGTVLISGLFIVSLPVLIEFVIFMGSQKSPVMRIRLDLVYSVFALFVILIGLRGVIRVIRLLGSDWRNHI